MEYLEARDGVYDGEYMFSNSVIRTVLDESTPIYQFYKGVNIFLTGASGFMGKVLVEKILRCYPEVGGIYILLRPKKNKTIESRLNEQFEDDLFDRLKKEQGNILSRKVHIIGGDLNQPMLGISSQEQQFIQSHVHVIVHAAASLRFDELLGDAYTLNVQATRDLLELATGCKLLKAFIHVSTLYTHSYLAAIKETFYPTQISYRDVEQMMLLTSEENVEILTPILFGKLYNNTYAFTKALGESVVEEYVHRLPLSMVRPAIVVSTWKEPIIGWVNNLYGPGGISAGAGLGLIHTFYAQPEKKCDLIPVDVATNMIVSVVWKTAQDHEKVTQGKEPSDSLTISSPVYNLSTSSRKPLTWSEFLEINTSLGLQDERYITCTLAVWALSFRLDNIRLVYLLKTFFLHMIPGMIADTILQFLNKEPRLMKIYIKIEKFSKYFIPYVERDWNFSTDHIDALHKELSVADLQTLDYSMDQFQWRDYFLFFFRGGRLYVLKLKYGDNTVAQIRSRRLWMAHYVLLGIVYSISALIIYKLFTFIFFHSVKSSNIGVQLIKT